MTNLDVISAVPGVTSSLTGISSWARGSGLEIVLLVTGTILLTRAASWAGARITDRIDAKARETDTLVRSEASKHRHALAQVITWATLVVIYCAAGVLIAARLGIPVTSLVAPAAVVAVALGFGAQRIVQDILAGFFIITERQYGFGDLISLTVPGLPSAAIGTVEDVTLRVTTVRTADGEVVITPNGQITQVTNLSRDWARAVVDVPVPAAVDVNRVSDLLRLIGNAAYQEPGVRRLLLDPPAVMGVQNIDLDQFQVRLVARTLPGKQFEIGRILRARITAVRARASTFRPAWRRPSRPEPPDAAGADLDLDPDRRLPGHPGDLPAGQAATGRNHRCYPGDDTILSLARAGHVTASGHPEANRADQADDHTETNRRGQATEFGVPCRDAPDPCSGEIVLLRGHASSLSHRHGIPLR